MSEKKNNTELDETVGLYLEILQQAAKPGGPSILRFTQRLLPAMGPYGLISPAKYRSSKGNGSTYVFETRPDEEGKPVHTVLIDSKTSFANRLELALQEARDEGQSTLAKMPLMVVEYNEGEEMLARETDLSLPHRAFDAHFRLGNFMDQNQKNEYDAARNASQNTVSNLFNLSPISVLFGVWDSTRKKRQCRIPSAIMGEIMGVLADQTTDPESCISRHSGARVDPVAASVWFSQDDIKQINNQSGIKLEEDKEDRPKERKKDGKVSGSAYVVGAIPPIADAASSPYGIATNKIISTCLISFASLRRLHFEEFGNAEDRAEKEEALRVLLAAIGLYAIVRNNSDVYLRANADISADVDPEVLVEGMGSIDVLSLEQAGSLLDEAYRLAKDKGAVNWENSEEFVVAGCDQVKRQIGNEADVDAGEQ